MNLPDGSLVQYDSTANADNEEERPRAWWFAKEIPGEKDKKRYEGMEETWKLLKETLEKEPFDIVLGFSQGESGFGRHRYQLYTQHCSPLMLYVYRTIFLMIGAALAGALASQLSLPNSPINHPPFKLAILVSGL